MSVAYVSIYSVKRPLNSFLDDLNRVARVDYEPTDDDVLRSSLRTIAPQEYRIKIKQSTSFFEGGGDLGKEWLLYDLGGSRTMVYAFFF